jgi:rRNA maturation RNase YbeY
MFVTNFFSENKNFKISNKKEIRALLKKICKKENKKISFINCVFCSDNRLLEINKKYLNHVSLTDVVTFDFTLNKKNLEGDIYISIDRVKENAKKYKETFKTELLRIIIHGLLHLIGFSDKTKEEKNIMTLKENEYLSLYNKLTFHVEHKQQQK